jgi:hypothetical protein
LAFALSLAAFGAMLFAHLSHPLLWQDEAETVMFGTRVLEYGYPKVHGPRNVVYEFGPDIALGVDERSDAYLGKTWGDFYFAVPGILWADDVSDVYAKTLRLRFPFALAGALGVAIWLWAVWPALGGGHRALKFGALYFLLAALSISLLLHLREARYYPLLVLNLGAVLALQLRHAVFGALAYRPYLIAQTALLVLLFQVFYPAWASVVLLLGAERAIAAWRVERVGRARRVARALAPFAASALLLLPVLVFFDIPQVALRFAEHAGASAGGYLDNLARTTAHLARHELLLPAALLHAALWGVERRRRWSGAVPRVTLARRSASLLAGFGLGYVATICLNPLHYERYFAVLSPLVTLVFLLDAHALLDALAEAAPAARRRVARATALAGLAVLVAVSLALRAEAIRGRLAEIREPYRGPVDFAVAHLLESYPHPESLVIATNYAAHPLMVYLGSRVIVGLSLNDIARERGLTPDVVLPRRRWPRGLPELRGFLARGTYRVETLDVLDLHFNNNPSLSPSPRVPDAHRFRTPHAGPGDPGRLRVYHRVDAASGS